ncbi:hypothetical protein FPV67DRAFT_1461982, partial [Lyophyllum atratum]
VRSGPNDPRVARFGLSRCEARRGVGGIKPSNPHGGPEQADVRLHSYGIEVRLASWLPIQLVDHELNSLEIKAEAQEELSATHGDPTARPVRTAVEAEDSSGGHREESTTLQQFPLVASHSLDGLLRLEVQWWRAVNKEDGLGNCMQCGPRLLPVPGCLILVPNRGKYNPLERDPQKKPTLGKYRVQYVPIVVISSASLHNALFLASARKMASSILYLMPSPKKCSRLSGFVQTAPFIRSLDTSPSHFPHIRRATGTYSTMTFANYAQTRPRVYSSLEPALTSVEQWSSLPSPIVTTAAAIRSATPSPSAGFNEVVDATNTEKHMFYHTGSSERSMYASVGPTVEWSDHSAVVEYLEEWCEALSRDKR